MRAAFAIVLCLVFAHPIVGNDSKNIDIGRLIEKRDFRGSAKDDENKSSSKTSFNERGFSLNDSLLAAAVQGDSEQVQQLLSKGASVTFCNAKGYNFLICASIGGLADVIKQHFSSIRHTIDDQVSDDCCGYDGFSALDFSLKFDHFDIAEFLIQNGADVNLKDKKGLTSIYYLVSTRNRRKIGRKHASFSTECVDREQRLIEFMIEKKVNFNLKSQGSSFLAYLLSVCDYELVDLALEHGCNPNDLSALEICVMDNNIAYLKKLVSLGADITQFEVGFSLLFSAIKYQAFDAAEHLVSEGVPLNIQNRNKNYCDGMTPLMAAALEPDLRYLKLLIEHDVNPNLQDADGKTALMFACDSNREQAVELLLTLEQNREAVDAEGWTAVHHAVRHGNLQDLKVLVQHGCNVNAQDNYGFTPLMLAVWNNHIKTARYLIDQGADLKQMVIRGDYRGSRAQNFVTSKEMRDLLSKFVKTEVTFAPKPSRSGALLISNAKWEWSMRGVIPEGWTTPISLISPEVELLITTDLHTDFPSDIHFVSYSYPEEEDGIRVSVPLVGHFNEEEARIRAKFPLANDTEIGERMRVKTIDIHNNESISTTSILESLRALKISPVLGSYVVLHGDTYHIRVYDSLGNGFNSSHMDYDIQGPDDHPLVQWSTDTANKLFELIQKKGYDK